MILILSIILFILLAIVGKSRGVKTFFSFYLSFILIMIFVVFMSFGFNAIILSLIICILSSMICLFLLNGYNLKTKSAFISIMIVLVILFSLIYFIGKNANITGFGYESLDSIGGYSSEINYDMSNVMIGMYLVCIIGTIIDTSISISSSMNEVYENNPKIKSNELYKSGMNVGGDILSTTISTLFFALISTFIGFFMWHHSNDIGYLLNYKIFASDLIELLLSFISSTLIIPITSYVSSKILMKESIWRVFNEKIRSK